MPIKFEDIADLLTEPYHPQRIQFPYRSYGKTSSIHKLCGSKLHYQAGIDSVYCHTCYKVPKKKVSVEKGNWEPSFTVKGFNNWKDATPLLKKHQDSERSASALQRIKTYLQTSMTQLRMDNLTVLHVHKENLDVKFSKRLCISA